MNRSRWKQIDDLFQRALEHAPDDRSRFLRTEIGDDDELGREVRSLLEANERSGAFFDSPVEGGVSRLLSLGDEEDAGAMVGQRFGAYRITSVIASGGMGTVFLASRDDDAYEKHVAIKLVKRGIGGASDASPARDSERLARFTLERQVLAELEHPSIARLFDGGTTDDGRPYLVMEHIDGLPIDEYCSSRALTVRARLELIVNVCKAVQHAHQNLIIHRDLKPSNILVTGDGVPKLLDFGLAKMLDPQRSATASKHTSAGQLMGTVAYAAPEQLSGSGQVDTRSDVYALGVILYRVLTRAHPYSVEGSMSEVLRRITEVMPDRPSKLSAKLGEELDTIVLKALAKEQDRRYQSAGDLAADIERYLAGEAVLAKGDSRWYVFRKTAHRYRLAITIAAAVLVTVIAFAALMSVQAARLADRSVALAQALRMSNIERGRAMAATGSITEAEQLLWSEWITGREESGRGSEADVAAYWALWELYFVYPCDLSYIGSLDDEIVFACSPDNGWLVVGREGERARLIGIDSGEEIGLLDASCTLDSCVTPVPDGNAVAIAEPGGVVAEYDASTGQRRAAFTTGLDEIRTISYTHDSIAVTSSDGVVVLDRLSREPRLSIPLPGAESRESVVSPDGSQLAVACQDGHVRMFDAATGEPKSVFLDPQQGWRRSPQEVTFSPDGRYLATDVNGTEVIIIDVKQKRVIANLDDPAGWVNSLHFHPTMTEPALLAASSTDKSLYVWEVPSGELVRRFSGHDVPLQEAMFSADGSCVYGVGPGLVRRWELAEHAGVRRLPTEGTVFHARFSPDGRSILAACGDGDNTIRIFDAETGTLTHVLRGHSGAVSSIDFETDGNILLSGSYDQTVRRWSMVDAEAPSTVLSTIGAHNSKINALAIAPDGSGFVVGGDGTFLMHRLPDGAILESKRFAPRRVPSAAYTPDGRYLVLAETPTSVLVRDTRSGMETRFSGHNLTIRFVCVSPDGAMVASAGDDLMIRLWSLREGSFGQEIATMSGHQQDVWALAFSPDGAMLASAGRSGVVKLWDVRSARSLATLDVHDDMVFSLEFSADGKTLLSGSRDQTVGVWDLEHYDRHIAGNLEYQRRRQEEKTPAHQ